MASKMVTVKIGGWEMIIPRTVANEPAQLDSIIKVLKEINDVSKGESQ